VRLLERSLTVSDGVKLDKYVKNKAASTAGPILSTLAYYYDHQNEVEEEIARVENDGSFTFT
jgi:hypothetical protein